MLVLQIILPSKKKGIVVYSSIVRLRKFKMKPSLKLEKNKQLFSSLKKYKLHRYNLLRINF